MLNLRMTRHSVIIVARSDLRSRGSDGPERKVSAGRNRPQALNARRRPNLKPQMRLKFLDISGPHSRIWKTTIGARGSRSRGPFRRAGDACYGRTTAVSGHFWRCRYGMRMRRARRPRRGVESTSTHGEGDRPIEGIWHPLAPSSSCRRGRHADAIRTTSVGFRLGGAH
jgi:hypothetical protein